MLKLFKFMLAVIVLVILAHYYNIHKKEKKSRELDKLDLIQEYHFPMIFLCFSYDCPMRFL